MPIQPATPRPTICLNMIVRNEAHIIREALDSAAPRIDRWVIVDTGSTDDTVATIERRMAEHGIPGEIHHRPWQDFGTNRTEALALANGQADYLWVIDADDKVEGDLDLTTLSADSYLLRYRVGVSFWRRQIFRSGLPWRYEGVLHEYPVCDAPASEARLDGDYEVHGRKLGARSADPQKYQRDADLLRSVLARDPDDLRSRFYLGQSLADAGDDEGALEAYTRRAELGGWDEERCLSLIRRADCLQRLGRPWAESLESLLDAYEARPTRAEPFARIARHYREQGKFRLGYAFARQAAALTYPTDDNLFVDAGVYAWAARDEQAVCASYIDRPAEALDLGTQLLASAALPDDQRERVAANRDACVAEVREQRTAYPTEIVAQLAAAATSGDPRVRATADVTVTVHAHGDRAQLERSLNAFLHCCADLDRVARFVCLYPSGDAAAGRELLARYPFLELLRAPAGEDGAAAMNRLLDLVQTPYWLHLDDAWGLFARGAHIERAARLLEADPEIGQVAFNRDYAVSLADRHLVGSELRTLHGVRYRIQRHRPTDSEAWRRFRSRMSPAARTNAHWPHFTVQPSLMAVDRVRKVGTFGAGDEFERAFAERFVAAGLQTAFFDEVTALRSGLPDAAVPVGPPAPASLTRLVPTARIGELDLDFDPPWPVVSAGATVEDGALRLAIRAQDDDEAPHDYALGFGPSLELESLERVTAPIVVSGPLAVPFGGGELRGEAVDGGSHRLVLHADGVDVRSSPPFSATGAEQERLQAMAWLEAGLLLVIGLYAERVVVVLVGRAEIEALLDEDTRGTGVSAMRR